MKARQKKLLAKKKAEQQALWSANDEKNGGDGGGIVKSAPLRTNFVSSNDIKAERRGSRCQPAVGRPNRAMDEIVSCPFCGVHMPASKMVDHKIIHPNKIIPRLWLGNFENARDKDTLKSKCKVTHIFNCAKELKCYHPTAFKYYHLQLMDREGQEMTSEFNKAFKFMDKALAKPKGVLFVHCQEGKSRSVTFVAAWLMSRKGMTLNSALATITSKRRIAQPNKGFLAQLVKYEKHLQEQRAEEADE